MLHQQTATPLFTVLQRSRLANIATSVSNSTSSISTASVTTADATARTQIHHHYSTSDRDNTATRDTPRPKTETKRSAGIKPGMQNFTLSYKDAAYQWWTSVSALKAQRTVLDFVPYIREAGDESANDESTSTPDPHGPRIRKHSLVQLSGKNRAINEVCIERVGEETEDALVMLHGYGAGLAMFYRNFEPITRVPGTKLYALDLLGMGNSSRPPFKMTSKTVEERVVEAEHWFIDALEEWRAARKIERFTLLGHSLGGYLAVSYATKYPGHLKKLILASPVGVPENPYAVDSSLPEPTDSTLQNEFTQGQDTTTKSDNPSQVKASGNSSNAPKKSLPSWFVWLWDANVSPFTFVRNSGPLGPRFMSAWTSRRFSHLPPNESQALHEYCFTLFKQKGSGEYALSRILAPGAYARRPIVNRIDEVGRQVIKKPDGSQVKETGIPVVFMYGENDWMDVAGGLASEQKLNEARDKALREGTEQEKRNEKGRTSVLIVPKAGHNLFLDNPEGFNKLVVDELNDTRAEEKRNERSG